MTTIVDIVVHCWLVLGEMAPYLLLGFLVAGILSVAVPTRWIERHLGRESIGSAIKAALWGVPLPLCSCSVLPVLASMRKHGASRTATASFLLSTPQTGVDSIAATYALLGPVMAVYRPVMALVSGVLGGALVSWWGSKDEPQPVPTKAGCASGGCCGAMPSKGCNEGPAVQRALRYALVTLPREMGVALLLGVAVAGLVAALVPADQFKSYLSGNVGAMLLMLVIGMPVYICALGAVPMAAGFIHMGASPGVAFVFLVAAPATNAVAIGAAWKVLGRRTALLYVLTVAIVAIGGGLLFDAMFDRLTVLPTTLGAAEGLEEVSLLTHVWAVLLLSIVAFAYLEPLVRRIGRRARGANPN